MNGFGNAPVVVVLAGGRGQRFRGEGHKLGQAFSQTTLLAHTLGAVLSARLQMVVVTTAPLVPIALSVVAARDIVLVPPVGSATHEPVGMGYSIGAGVSARSQAPGWLILPGDMPLVRPASLQAVAQAMSHHPVVYAQHRGRRGHPVGFSAELYSELVTLAGDEGARRLLARYPAQAVELDDPGVLVDVDTEDDLDAARSLHTRSSLMGLLDGP